MKIKTSELTGPALDWAVEYASLSRVEPDSMRVAIASRNRGCSQTGASTSWAVGGPILTNARISRTIDHSGLWIAYWTDGYGDGDEANRCMQCDRSELVAGLRCYVTLGLGEEVEIPDELTPTEPAITLNRQAVWPFR